jgi:hypothetical protein
MITGVPASSVTAVGVAVLVLVGLPLLALGVSRWRGWSRLRPGREDDPWVDVQRRHRITPLEMQQAISYIGSREQWPRPPIEDPVLRAVVVDWESWHLARAEARAARPGLLALLARVVEAPMRSQYRRIIEQHGGSAEPVRKGPRPR